MPAKLILSFRNKEPVVAWEPHAFMLFFFSLSPQIHGVPRNFLVHNRMLQSLVLCHNKLKRDPLGTHRLISLVFIKSRYMRRTFCNAAQQ